MKTNGRRHDSTGVEMGDGSTLTIRPVRDADGANLLRFLSSLAPARPGGGGDGLDRLAVRKALRRPRPSLLERVLGTLRGRVVGVGALLLPAEPGIVRTGEVRIVVVPRHRGLGVGRAILNELVSVGVQRGLHRISVVSREPRDLLRQACRALGIRGRAGETGLGAPWGDRRDRVHREIEIDDLLEPQETMLQRTHLRSMSGHY
ncbi:MAG: GNAT family N-acetyltransferase [Planctomycetes bacterium]|nr:GNAT family N-acetyltransferase [Planctomycetota bacterium]